MAAKKSYAVPKKIIKLPRSAGMSATQVRELYKSHIKKYHKRSNRTVISQRNVVIETDDTWFNAEPIPRDPAWVQVNDADYLWNSRDLGSNVAIVSRPFRLSLRRAILSASLLLSVDNYAVVLINGRTVVFDAPQNTPSFFNPGRTFNVRRFLRRGNNDIVIVAFNFGGGRSVTNPAGVAARLRIQLSELQ